MLSSVMSHHKKKKRKKKATINFNILTNKPMI